MDKNSAIKVDEIAMLEDSVVEYCRKQLPVERLHTIRDSENNFDNERWRQMCALGWPSILFTEKQGGLAMGVRAAITVCRQLGKVVAPEPMVEIGIETATLCSHLNLPHQWTSTLQNGEKLIFTDLSAKTSGSGLVAEQVGDQFFLTGCITDIPIADRNSQIIVQAKLDNALSLFLVNLENKSIGLEKIKKCDGSKSAKLSFSNFLVSEKLNLAENKRTEEAIEEARATSILASSAYLVGLSESLLEITLDYLKTRKQFGKPIGSFQALQHRAVDLYTQKCLAAAVLDEAIEIFEREGSALEKSTVASRAKYRSNVAALQITREAVQMHGGIGYTNECNVGLYLNRALVLIAKQGNCAEQISFLRKNILSSKTKDQDMELSQKVIKAKETQLWLSMPEGGWQDLSDQEFRVIARAFLESEYPSSLRFSSQRLRWEQIKNWYIHQSASGWLAPAWPVKFGGMGLTPSQQMIYIEEQERWGVGRAPDMGIVMVGPLLIKHGTKEQIKQYLPKILSGDHIWCQGYSEPNSGSDLASLQTKAELSGDEFIINGQKTWTTLAQDATHMFCLARTSSQGKQQQGITFFLIDLNQEGVSIRPISNIAGHEEFCEVFLDNVKVSTDCMVGEINEGWSIAKALLGFERIFLGSPRQSQYVLQRLESAAIQCDLMKQTSFQEKLTRLKLDVLDLESNYQKFADLVRSGQTLGPDVSMLKIWATETFARLTELLIEIAGSNGANLGDVSFNGENIDIMSQFYNARPATIYGGSNEIQRNIIAKFVLELPTHQ